MRQPSFFSRSILPRDEQPAAAEASTALPAPLAATGDGGLELNHLWRYAGVIGLVAACAMLSAWSRIDLVETSAALGSAEARLSTAMAEQARLRLELAALSDPARLARAASGLGLDATVRVVDIDPEAAAPAEVAEVSR